MSFASKLFSFEGRIGRLDYWTLSLLLTVFVAAVWVVGGYTLLGSPEAAGPDGKPPAPRALDWDVVTLWISAPLTIVAWPRLALQSKRWHDLDKSAWWGLLAFVPFGPLFMAWRLGAGAGTPGDNRFGPPAHDRSASLDRGFAASEERAVDAVERWRAEQAAKAPARSEPLRPISNTSSGGFGRRGLQPGPA